MNIHDLTKEIVELSIEEQSRITGGFGAFLFRAVAIVVTSKAVGAATDSFGIISLAEEISGKKIR